MESLKRIEFDQGDHHLARVYDPENDRGQVMDFCLANVKAAPERDMYFFANYSGENEWPNAADQVVRWIIGEEGDYDKP